MTRKLTAMAGGIALTGGLLAGSAGAAGAAPATPKAPSDCPSGYFCVWAGQNYTGHRQQVAGTNKDLTQYSVFQNFKSWYNHGAKCDFEWYSDRIPRTNQGCPTWSALCPDRRELCAG
ncbi:MULTISPECIES: peptidase inhibitor family I36 protein [Streptomyces]|uniref:Peptidase inhibitor family I36 protein n=2 Tax=Streptomyces rimosus subsp. rimosus TaxID=132474 RepID=A0A8A1ULJ2_STRR1|nr:MULTISPECIES: peptidase inhibitor family I36 protein [Streptomyces]MYT45136.1 hypothetical protein [Streptomyces sp. SID5471]QDA08421.1 hypothetical protein CTZ40_36440 [Streptomyces rimosus]QEV79699.1 hypothetical protein CP984_36400 [Streptomyces rimosus]QGY66449.1 hypothetical protein V519_011470 [Streptomyces rimosus R6-500]QST79544.1 peptidase inhibitor family I36 protein [Streptomyces rimosus subsp. rimosus ATCC 10970]